MLLDKGEVELNIYIKWPAGKVKTSTILGTSEFGVSERFAVSDLKFCLYVDKRPNHAEKATCFKIPTFFFSFSQRSLTRKTV